MSDNYGTKPAMVPLEAKRGFDMNVPFTIQDQEGVSYLDFPDWTFEFKVSLAAGSAQLLTLTNGETDAGSYISQVLEVDGTSTPQNFELILKASDMVVLAQSAGSSPDRFYHEIVATGPAFSRWPLAVGPLVIGKTT